MNSEYDQEPVSVAAEIALLLPETKGQLGLVAACLRDNITDRNAIVAAGTSANTGNVGNIFANIRAIRDGGVPRAPSMARSALSATRSFLNQHRTVLSAAAINHLQSIVARLEDAIDNETAQVEEEGELKAKGDELEHALAIEGGVYVYTFPQYWRYPTVAGTKRTLLKIGMTTREATSRVREQARGTAMPEEPMILRVYRSKTIEPRAAERSFHMLLNAADHTRVSNDAGGREWFETSVEFLDTVAAVLGMETLQAEAPS